MKTKKTLTEILKNQTITNQFNFTGSCPDKDGTSVSYTIFDTNFFLNEINHNFFNRVMFVDPDSSFADLVSTFSIWAANRGYMYARLMYAYAQGYNPIENYNSIEEHTGHDDYENHKTLTRTHTNDNVQRTYNQDKVAISHDNDKVTTTYNQLQDVNATTRTGVNSSTPVPVTTDTNTRTGSESQEFLGTRNETHTGGYTDSHTGSYADAATGTDKQIYDSTITKHGNIGVSTASGMIQELFDGLKQNLALRAVHDVLDAFTFYSGEVDLW